MPDVSPASGSSVDAHATRMRPACGNRRELAGRHVGLAIRGASPAGDGAVGAQSARMSTPGRHSAEEPTRRFRRTALVESPTRHSTVLAHAARMSRADRQIAESGPWSTIPPRLPPARAHQLAGDAQRAGHIPSRAHSPEIAFPQARVDDLARAPTFQRLVGAYPAGMPHARVDGNELSHRRIGRPRLIARFAVVGKKRIVAPTGDSAVRADAAGMAPAHRHGAELATRRVGEWPPPRMDHPTGDPVIGAQPTGVILAGGDPGELPAGPGGGLEALPACDALVGAHHTGHARTHRERLVGALGWIRNTRQAFALTHQGALGVQPAQPASIRDGAERSFLVQLLNVIVGVTSNRAVGDIAERNLRRCSIIRAATSRCSTHRRGGDPQRTHDPPPRPSHYWPAP